MNSEKVAILLSTFNGEKYLREQIASLLNQTHDNFIIYIRDDGSTDSTIEILESYSSQTEKVVVLKDSLGNIGVAKSYRLLMEFTSSDYYLFADQDDFWEQNKIEKLLEIAQKSTAKDEPYLLFSNMTVFHENSSKDYDFFKKFKIDDLTIKNGLFQGTISGCLMIFNDKAKQISLDLNPKSNMLHDWDILMSCYLLGEIELTDEHLIKHRLHDSNVIGENLKKPVLTLLKDLVKFTFRSSAYRKVELKDYFDYIGSCVNNIDNQVRIKKDLLTEDEIKSLTFLRRKKWYLKHFNPFIYGKTRGLLILLTV